MIYLKDTPYRILSHKKTSDCDGQVLIWLVDLSLHKFHIVKRTLAQLQDEMSAGKLCSCVDTESYKVPLLKEGDKALTDLRYASIQRFIDNMYPDYSLLSQRGAPKESLKELAAVCGISPKNMRRYVLAYIQSGGTYVSVVDKRLTRAMDEEYDPYAGLVRGRHRKGSPSMVLNDSRLFALYEEAYADFERKVNKYQYDSDTKFKPTLKSAFRTMLSKHFTTENELGKLEMLPDDQRPSYDRFLHWVRKQKLHGDKVRSHAVSARDRRNNHRLLVGTSDYGVFNPMELVEIEENECSSSLISANPGTPNQAIGHAVTYIAIDVLTHRIVGASVGFANNSYEGFLDVMDSMMMSDEENARMFGVEYDPSAPVFPGCRLPNEIRVDHGSEYISKAITDNLTGGNGSTVLEGLPIAINLAPVAMGSLKGLVERFFRTLHQNVQNALGSGMGYVTGTHVAKHHQEAVLTIEDFRMIVYETIKAHNSALIVGYPVTPELSAALQAITPNALWEHFSKTRLCGFDVSDMRKRIVARYGLMKNDKDFRLSRKQISYRNTLYWDLQDDEALTFEALKLGDGSAPVAVRYDPRSVNCLYRLDPKTGTVYRYELAEKRTNMRGFYNMRWPIAEHWISGARSKDYESKKQNDDALVLLEGRLRTVAEQASDAKDPVKNSVNDRKSYAQIERAALTAYDTARKNSIFYGDPLEYIADANRGAEVAVTVTPIPAPEAAKDDAIIPVVDLNDMSAVAKAYGLLSEEE